MASLFSNKNYFFFIFFLFSLFFFILFFFFLIFNFLIFFQGIHLTDLTFIDDGNETFLDPEKTMINVTKIRLLASSIKMIRVGSSIIYDSITPSNTIQRVLKSVEVWDDHEIYRISKLKEEPLKKGEELKEPKRLNLIFNFSIF